MTQLSIGITAHSEGVTLHKTLLSVVAATQPLEDAQITYEVLLQLDNPTEETSNYSKRIAHLFPEIPLTITTSSFGNPSESRNHIVSRAKGVYITFIDGDDLMSRNWLQSALEYLQESEKDNSKATHVAHPEVVMEFDAVNTIVRRHGEIDRSHDTLLSVYANRWNVVLMIRREFLKNHPYPTQKGYGFEDWYINCLTIFEGLHNTLIPETSLFVRRKKENSVWLTHQSEFAVLPANPLLSFSNIRDTTTPDTITTLDSGQYSTVKKALKKYRPMRIAGKAMKKLITTIKTVAPPPPLPAWLQSEREYLYTLDKTIDPFSTPDYYDTITEEHYSAAFTYKQLVDSLSYDEYGYILFAPWLIKGGADLFTLNYANSIAEASPKKKVLLITTTAADSPWAQRLNKNVSILEFGKITQGQPESVVLRVLEHVVENSGASHLHIINSELGYQFTSQHKKYLTSTNKTIIATSFSQSTDNSGRIFGYSHTHVPTVYSVLSAITTDNTPVRDMWLSEYGFNKDLIMIHNQPVALPERVANPKQDPSEDNPLNILWAARLSPEKQPEILENIATELINKPVHIHIYGQPDDGFNTTFLSRLPKNTTYHGSFNGFDSLKPESFDVYLYTSLFDGMPNSILEAASYGLPIIASAVGGVPTFIEDGQNGLIVNDLKNAKEYANKINLLLEEPERLSSFGGSVRAKIKTDFSKESYNKQIIAMLKKVKYL